MNGTDDMWRTIRALREDVRELRGQLDLALDRIRHLEAEHEAGVRREAWELREASDRGPEYGPPADTHGEGGMPEPQTAPAAMRRFMREYPLSAGPGRCWAPLRGCGTCPRCGVLPGELHRTGCSTTHEPEPGDPSYVDKSCPDCGVQPGQEHTPRCGARGSGMTHWQGWDGGEPERAERGPGPEVDDEGGMSEHRHVLPQDDGREGGAP